MCFAGPWGGMKLGLSLLSFPVMGYPHTPSTHPPPPPIPTVHGGRIGKTKSTAFLHTEDLEVETQPSQTNDLQNWYLSLPSLALDINRITQGLGWLNAGIMWLSGKLGHGAGGLFSILVLQHISFTLTLVLAGGWISTWIFWKWCIAVPWRRVETSLQDKYFLSKDQTSQFCISGQSNHSGRRPCHICCRIGFSKIDQDIKGVNYPHTI